MKMNKMCGVFFMTTFFATHLFAAEVVLQATPVLTVQEPVVVAPTVVAPTVAPTVVEPTVIAPVVVAPEPVVVAPTVAVPTPVVTPTVVAPEPAVTPVPTLVAPVPTVEPIVKVPIVTPTVALPVAPPTIKTPVLTPDIRTPAALPAVQIKEPVAPSGVVPGHAYTVLGTSKDESANETVILRNPWGSGDPNAQEPKDANSVVQGVLHDSYQETGKDLQSHADKVRSFNESKNAVRESGNDLRSASREFKSDSGSEKDQLVVLFEVFKESIDEQNQDRKYWIEKLSRMNEIGEALSDYMRDLTDAAGSLGGKANQDSGDEDNLEKMDLMTLQQKFQNQARQYQTISNVLRARHDSANSAIRNMRGEEGGSQGTGESSSGSAQPVVESRKKPLSAKPVAVRKKSEVAVESTKPMAGRFFGRKISTLMKEGKSTEVAREIKTYMAELDKPGADKSFYVTRLKEVGNISEMVLAQVVDIKGRKFTLPQELKILKGMTPREMSRQLQKQSEFFDELIQEFEEQLESTGDDAQLANIDLQNMLQKQQQTIQMMSNVSKMMHDTALAVIRKIG